VIREIQKRKEFSALSFPSVPNACIGFPPGFQDVLHDLRVVRQAVIASSFGLRFLGSGYFLTDACTHGGTNAAHQWLTINLLAGAVSKEQDMPHGSQ
jgi:hypothetical protein